jgi:hypothetical protein
MEISRYASRLAAASPLLPSSSPRSNMPSESNGPVAADGGAERASSLTLNAAMSLPQEPDDARLTGGTRSLSRRLLALNVPGMPTPDLSAARKAEPPASRASSARKSRSRKSVLANPGIIAGQA